MGHEAFVQFCLLMIRMAPSDACSTISSTTRFTNSTTCWRPMTYIVSFTNCSFKLMQIASLQRFAILIRHFALHARFQPSYIGHFRHRCCTCGRSELPTPSFSKSIIRLERIKKIEKRTKLFLATGNIYNILFMRLSGLLLLVHHFSRYPIVIFQICSTLITP